MPLFNSNHCKVQHITRILWFGIHQNNIWSYKLSIQYFKRFVRLEREALKVSKYCITLGRSWHHHLTNLQKPCQKRQLQSEIVQQNWNKTSKNQSHVKQKPLAQQCSLMYITIIQDKNWLFISSIKKGTLMQPLKGMKLLFLWFTTAFAANLDL